MVRSSQDIHNQLIGLELKNHRFFDFPSFCESNGLPTQEIPNKHVPKFVQGFTNLGAN